MKSYKIISVLTITIILLLSIGCSKKYVITTELSEAIEAKQNCLIGEIVNDLPIDLNPDKEFRDYYTFKLGAYLIEEINKKNIFSQIDYDNPEAKYIIEGNILDYNEGSGSVRYVNSKMGIFSSIIGVDEGNAKLKVRLNVKNRESNIVIFEGIFDQTIKQWTESCDEAFKKVAKDFAKELKKQFENMGGY